MLRHYLTIAYRSLLRARMFSAINILGLTLGTACALYILLYVLDQYRYDRHHVDGDRIYRIVTDTKMGTGDWWHTATSSPPIAPAMKADFPEVALSTRLLRQAEVQLLRQDDQAFFIENGYYVDSTFFQVFTYQFVEGDPRQALQQPYTLVLTLPIAQKIFGAEKALGKTLTIENTAGRSVYTVTGVIDPAFGKSHIRANFYMAMNSGGIGEYVRTNDQWAGNNFVHSYVRLDGPVDPKKLEAKFPEFLQRHGANQLKNLGMTKMLSLEPIRDIHLYSDRENQVETTTKASFLYILLLIAGLIQTIACINFMNLTTARATRRAREVSIRKVVGAGRSALVGQFLGESMLVAVLAVSLAFPLLSALLPVLNKFSGAEVSLSIFRESNLWWVALGLALGTGLLAGIYPAFYQSAVKLLPGLKGNSGRSPSGLLRQALVVFQFVVSIVLMLGVAAINAQMAFIQQKDLGFMQEHQIVLPFRTPQAMVQLPAVKAELERLPEVNAVSATAVAPGQFVPYDFGMFAEGKDMNSSVNVKFTWTDEDYLPTLQIPLLEGRNFRPTDTLNQIIVNQTYLRSLSIPQAGAVGTRVYAMRDGVRTDYEIIGVMGDFNFQPLYVDISPFMLFYENNPEFQNLMISAKGAPDVAMINKIQDTWERTTGGIPFEYSFLDEKLESQYKPEYALLAIIQSFTFIAILISCLGLFGLSVFSAEQRVKEIGIRKVLGASIAQIIRLLSADFVRLVAVATLIAFPLAWWGMDRWLENFAYRAPLSAWMFVAVGAAALGIALLTVGAHALRAAMGNPVEALRREG